MSLRKRAGLRLVRLLTYHGLIEHPYGRDYARLRFTATGGERFEPDEL